MNKNHKKISYLIVGFLAVLCLIAIDQFTKLLAIKYLKEQSSITLIKGVFELQYLENRGIAFGLFQEQLSWILVLGIVILVVLGFVYQKIPARRYYLPLHILCISTGAGALGNIIDRIFRGYVVDFFYFSLIDFPIFNVADIYITLSAIAALILILFYYKDEDFSFLSKRKKQGTQDEEA